jgi:EAL domain-containing protein (putative c-di-GMP-specific phosphodiesterase class I)
VETAAQLNALQNLGCDLVQGFLISRPLSPSATTELLLNGDLAHPGKPVTAPSERFLAKP